MSDPLHIQIPAATAAALDPELASILESLFPVRFNSGPVRETVRAGEIRIEPFPKAAGAEAPTAVASLAVPSGADAARPGTLHEVPVHFADDPNVPFPFRGRSLRVKVAVEPRLLALEAGEKVLATCESGPVWTQLQRGGVKHFRSGLVLPGIPAAGNLQDVLNGERFLELLPLLHFLRELSGGQGYEGPPLRAGFIFDDPNLHWPTYGHVNYREVVAHADRENYHVSFATVPLDAWFTHAGTAAIFRNHADRISLCVHGNDHTKQELARNFSQPGRVALLRQAIRRIERLEQRAGLQVARVMVPPHGACAEAMLEATPQCGFEGACISHGSLRAHNRTQPWAKTLGYRPAELVAGCPVLPRWSFAGNPTNTILLAAYLRQPMILRGHHQDLKVGIGLLDELARTVNSLGAVNWSNLTELMRANYQWRMDGDLCRLQPLGRSINFPIPSHATRLVIENPGNRLASTWQLTGLRDGALSVQAGEEITWPQTGSRHISLASPAQAVPEDPARRPVVAAFLRRLATEGRDRLLS